MDSQCQYAQTPLDKVDESQLRELYNKLDELKNVAATQQLLNKQSKKKRKRQNGAAKTESVKKVVVKKVLSSWQLKTANIFVRNAIFTGVKYYTKEVKKNHDVSNMLMRHVGIEPPEYCQYREQVDKFIQKKIQQAGFAAKKRLQQVYKGQRDTGECLQSSCSEITTAKHRPITLNTMSTKFSSEAPFSFQRNGFPEEYESWYDAFIAMLNARKGGISPTEATSQMLEVAITFFFVFVPQVAVYVNCNRPT